MPQFVPLLAHIGSPNNPWIGVMTVSAWVVLLIYVLVVANRIKLDAPGDLLLPLAAVVLVAGLTGSLGDTINDQGPWAVPAGVVALGALLVGAFRDVSFNWSNRRSWGVLGLAAVASIGLYGPLNSLWFPTDASGELLPELPDAGVAAEVVDPLGDDGKVRVRVTLDGATFGDTIFATRPDDPTRDLVPRFQVGVIYLTPPVPPDCAEADDCAEATFDLTLPPGVAEDPPDSFVVELLTADGLPFAPPLQTRFEVTPP